MNGPLAASLRTALVEAMLPDVPSDGWSRPALRAAARRVGLSPEEALALFPGGAADLVAAFSRWADHRVLDRLATLPHDELPTARRIALAIGLRLDLLEPWREAVRRAVAVLVLPQNAPLALQLLYETIDGIWHAAGDRAADFSFYTKRASLAAVLSATLLYWLDDRSPGAADTRAFLERRLAGAARVGAARRRLAAIATGLPHPLRLLRPYR